MALDGREVLEYACAKFESGKYDEALEAFILAYGKGYDREWILENIYNCYMQGNEEEFQAAYEGLDGKTIVPYENCTLDFIPYREGEYYIFDKEEMCFRGIFSIKNIEQAELDAELQKMEFSAAAAEIEWDWNDIRHIVTDAKKRKLYVICRDLRRAASFCKIPEFVEYMKNIKLFSDWDQFQNYFHENTAVYLPKIFYGLDEGGQKFYEFVQREHAYRLTPEGRNTENVLLTIAIPTANRGHLLLKRMEHLLKMQYDSEIEISISKNGTTFFEEEYNEVGRMVDARINYYDHGKEIKYNINWAYAIQMAHGRYAVLVSDEDDVILEALEHYMRLLSEYPELSVVRAKTNFQCANIVERQYGKKGTEAFECEFLLQNYLSGLILKRETFIQADLLELERFSENPFYRYYPHEWWCAILSMMGDYMQEPVSLIAEGDSVLVEEIKRYRDAGMIGQEEGTVGSSALPQYATYDARLEQFKGEIDFLELFSHGDSEIETIGLDRAIFKTAYLFKLARDLNYNCENFMPKIGEFADICIETIENVALNNEQKKRLLMSVNKWCTWLYMLDEQLNENLENNA